MPLASKRQRTIRLWKEMLYDTRGSESENLQDKRLALMEYWGKNPWLYMNGRDIPDQEQDPEWFESGGRPIYWTVDERDEENAVKPFPSVMDPENFAYLKDLTTELWGKYRIVFLDKARQVFATTLACANIDWFGTFRDEREVFVSRVKEQSAVKLINDRIRTPHSRLVMGRTPR